MAPRRSSRASTPTSQRATSPRLSTSTSTPSISSLAPPPSSVRKSTSTKVLSPRVSSAKKSKSSNDRPALPLKDANKLFAKETKTHKVKVQKLHLGEGSTETITIARVKCPVPKGVPGHLIKRFDTKAVSATSLFRAAFPTASEEDEAKEMNYIANRSGNAYGDTKKAGAEHDEASKLSGTWIPAAHATTLAQEYNILKFAKDLIEFNDEDVLAANGAAAPVTGEISGVPDSEMDSPAVRSPRSKRQRISSPTSISTPTRARSPRSAALSGASANGVSILQTLAIDAKTGVTTETTEVKVDVPVLESDLAAVSNGLVASDELVAAQIKESQLLVQQLKQEGVLKTLADSTQISTKKRELEAEEGEEDENSVSPTSGTLADLADSRGFFGKIFKRRQRAPRTAGREIKASPSHAGRELIVIERQEVEGRRWVAGFGLALAVGATAAAPYFFG